MIKGFFKIIILKKLNERDRSGYDLIKEIESLFEKKPSAGSIYPMHNDLFDKEMITCKEEDRRKIYSITSEGKKFLKENKKVIAGILKSLKENKILPQIEKITNDFKDITKETIKLAVESAKEGSKDIKKKMKKTSGILKETLKEITDTWKG